MNWDTTLVWKREVWQSVGWIEGDIGFVARQVEFASYNLPGRQIFCTRYMRTRILIAQTCLVLGARVKGINTI